MLSASDAAGFSGPTMHAASQASPDLGDPIQQASQRASATCTAKFVDEVWVAPHSLSAQQTRQVADQCKLDSRLSAVLLYGAAHTLNNPEARTQGRHDYLLRAYCLVATVKAAVADVGQQTLLLQQQQSAEVTGGLWSVAEAGELLLLCLTALERHRNSHAAGVPPEAADVAGMGAAMGHAAVPGSSWDQISIDAMLVQLMCVLIDQPFGALSTPPTMSGTASAAGSGSSLCPSGHVEPGSQDPAAPSVSSSSQCEQPAVTSTALAVCRVVEAYARQLAGQPVARSIGSGLPTLDLIQHRLSVYHTSKMCCAKLAASSQPDQEAVGALVAIAATPGPSSRLQVQLYLFSLWSSLLKLDAIHRLSCGCETDTAREVVGINSELYLSTLCAETAVALLECSVPGKTATDRPPAAEPPARDTAVGSHSSTSSVNSSATGTTSTFVLPGLMWIMLLGHCCKHWAGTIAGACATGGSSSSSIPELAAALRTAGQQHAANSSTPPESSFTLRLVVKTVQNLFAPNSSMVQQLSACGYDITLVTDSAAATRALAALDAFVQSPDSGNSAITVLCELASAVKALGEALTSLAAPYCCTNPACLNISGPSDVALVSGKSCICGKCKVARYCGKACQQQHWRLHKPVCKALAAAQQGARSATG